MVGIDHLHPLAILNVIPFAGLGSFARGTSWYDGRPRIRNLFHSCAIHSQLLPVLTMEAKSQRPTERDGGISTPNVFLSVFHCISRLLYSLHSSRPRQEENTSSSQSHHFSSSKAPVTLYFTSFAVRMGAQGTTSTLTQRHPAAGIFPKFHPSPPPRSRWLGGMVPRNGKGSSLDGLSAVSNDQHQCHI